MQRCGPVTILLHHNPEQPIMSMPSSTSQGSICHHPGVPSLVTWLVMGPVCAALFLIAEVLGHKLYDQSTFPMYHNAHDCICIPSKYNDTINSTFFTISNSSAYFFISMSKYQVILFAYCYTILTVNKTLQC